jgi:hypothetical protein
MFTNFLQMTWMKQTITLINKKYYCKSKLTITEVRKTLNK